MSKRISDLLERARSWPQNAQDELASLASEIEAELNAGRYTASDAELAGIDRGLQDAADGRFASADDIDALLSKPAK